MNAFIYSVGLQWKLDLRNKGILVTYYIVPLVFFGFMGAIFSSINPQSKDTIIQSMSIFSVTMGAILGSPIPIVALYGSEVKKAYKASNIPLSIPAISNFISAFINLFIVSLIIFFIAPIAFDSPIPPNVPLYFLALIIFILVSLSIGTLLGLLVKSSSKITMFSQLIFLPSLMLSGIMFPTSLLPKSFDAVGKILPATHAMKIMTRNTFDIKMFLPLIFILAVMLSLSKFKISKMSVE
jgi:ABC-2 type transport system permease protein